MQTCHEAAPCGPWLKRMTLLHVAPRSLIIWNINVRVFIFHCREETEWKCRFKPQVDEDIWVSAAVFLTGAPHQVPLLLSQLVLHHPHHVFSLLPLKPVPLVHSKTFQMNCFQHGKATHLKPLLFHSVVFVQLGLQEAEVPELLDIDVILLLQIFLNILVLVHEGGPGWVHRDKMFTQGVGSASTLLTCELTSHSAVFEASSDISPALASFSQFCCPDWFRQTQHCPACLWSSPHFPNDTQFSTGLTLKHRKEEELQSKEKSHIPEPLWQQLSRPFPSRWFQVVWRWRQFSFPVEICASCVHLTCAIIIHYKAKKCLKITHLAACYL